MTVMENKEDFSPVINSISDTVFGCGKNTFLLIDATLESYGTEYDFYEELKKHDKNLINFPHSELIGALPLYLVVLDNNSARSQALFKARLCPLIA